MAPAPSPQDAGVDEFVLRWWEQLVIGFGIFAAGFKRFILTPHRDRKRLLSDVDAMRSELTETKDRTEELHKQSLARIDEISKRVDRVLEILAEKGSR